MCKMTQLKGAKLEKTYQLTKTFLSRNALMQNMQGKAELLQMSLYKPKSQPEPRLPLRIHPLPQDIVLMR